MIETMRSEMQVRFGPVAESLADGARIDDAFAMSRDAFLFVTPVGVRFHYRVGEAIRAELPGAETQDEYLLYLWGTVFGAVAWLNGFVPLHASAVAVRDRIVAFTADSGGGKSTLAAALARAGLTHVCDDTLVLDVQTDGVTAMPDGKPLKLWDDALTLTGTSAEAPVGIMPGKNYARAARTTDRAMPLTDLVLLDRGDTIALEPVRGAAKLAMLRDALYRDFIHAARGDDALHARLMLDISSQVRFWRLTRPFPADDFARDVKDIVAILP